MVRPRVGLSNIPPIRSPENPPPGRICDISDSSKYVWQCVRLNFSFKDVSCGCGAVVGCVSKIQPSQELGGTIEDLKRASRGV